MKDKKNVPNYCKLYLLKELGSTPLDYFRTHYYTIITINSCQYDKIICGVIWNDPYR
jgi:hypothetical protein